MSLQTKTIIEEELRNVANLTWFTKNFIRCHKNWHHGETCKFENHFDEKDKKCFQFRTIIEKPNNENYFIYDEIVKIKDKTFFLLILHDDKRKKVWELLIYFENNEIVQQIRHLRYKQFVNEIKNNEELIKKESKHTTIIRTPFLEFVRTITNQKQENIIEEVQDKYWIFKRFIWKIFHGLIFFIVWGATSPIAKIIITPIISTFIVSSAIMGWLPFTIAGIVAGICYKILCECAKKLRTVMFSNVKDKYQLELEQKIKELENRTNNLEEEVQFLKDISLNSKEVIEKRILNCLQQTREKNEPKTFKTLKKELNRKFKRNKFSKKYYQSINQWNEKWQENIAFSKYLEPKHIKKIKDVFTENKKEKYQIESEEKTKEIWSEFQEWKNKLKELEKEASETRVNGFIPEEDNRQKSPARTMKRTGL